MLIVLAGLPGVGKTAIAKALARRFDAVHLRIDSIEQALRGSSMGAGTPMDDAGYRVGYAIAADNLAAGRIVIADSVNPWPETRDAWLAVARHAGVRAVEIEVICSDPAEHRRRVETRTADIAGLRLPTWQDVVERDYRPFARERIAIDTSRMPVEACVAAIETALAGARES